MAKDKQKTKILPSKNVGAAPKLVSKASKK